MKRPLTQSELVRLYALWDKCGEGDLLDFINWIRRTAKKNGWSTETVLTICDHIPEEKHQ